MTADAAPLDQAQPLDRRQRRRQETIEEVLDIAVEIMTSQGVAGLTLGEVARRMGIRPPSLYVYFASKEAIYDAVFLRGARAILEHMQAHSANLQLEGRTFAEILLDAGRAMARWSVENPAYTQMLFWRPVPGFIPSEEAYAPAVALVELSAGFFRSMQQQGLLRADVNLDEALRDWTVLTAGVVSQQMSNAPDSSFDDGPFTARLPVLVDMFCAHYGATTTSTSARGTRNARKR
jgi:AcrR family transcriptional regulator